MQLADNKSEESAALDWHRKQRLKDFGAETLIYFKNNCTCEYEGFI